MASNQLGYLEGNVRKQPALTPAKLRRARGHFAVCISTGHLLNMLVRHCIACRQQGPLVTTAIISASLAEAIGLQAIVIRLKAWGIRVLLDLKDIRDVKELRVRTTDATYDRADGIILPDLGTSALRDLKIECVQVAADAVARPRPALYVHVPARGANPMRSVSHAIKAGYDGVIVPSNTLPRVVGLHERQLWIGSPLDMPHQNGPVTSQILKKGGHCVIGYNLNRCLDPIGRLRQELASLAAALPKQRV